MPDSSRFQILVAASEVVGFAKTGGLAEVAGTLPRALAERGHQCAVIMPLYRSARSGSAPLRPTPHALSVPVGGRLVDGRLWRTTLPNSEVPLFLVEQSHYFERDDPSAGRGLYQFTQPDGQRVDYPDNSERFIFFSRAVLEAVPFLDFRPEIIHANDWQTGLVPVYLREKYRGRGAFRDTGTLFTIHNMAYQGRFRHWDMGLTGLDWRLFNEHQLEFYGHLNFLKAGIIFADAISTVSPTYAREIQTSEFGCGLEGVLSERRDRLFGIVNGVDYGVWDPGIDSSLVATYDITTVFDRKPLNKQALQQRMGLPVEPHRPVLGMVSRLAEQKGIELIGKVAPSVIAEGAQVVVVGEGERRYEHTLQALRDRFPDRIGIHLGFDERLAHLVEGGADAFLMPSKYEPAGLNQLYSLRYGTVPIVRSVGGLADTVVDCTEQTLADGTATGFTFQRYHPDALLAAIRRALEFFLDKPALWLQLVRTGMSQDWSWDRSAAQYEKIFALVRQAWTEPASALR